MAGLIGTPKQIEWATRIRVEMGGRWGRKLLPDIAEARFWIDNRDALVLGEVTRAAREFEAERDANFDSPFTDLFPRQGRAEARAAMEALCRLAGTIGVVVLDLETTGLERSDRIVEIAAVRWPSREVLIDSLVRPPDGLVPAEVTQLSSEDVAAAPRFRDWPLDILRWVETCHLVSWNTRFDVPVLRREIMDCGWEPYAVPVEDFIASRHVPAVRATDAMRLAAAWLDLDGWPGLAEAMRRLGLPRAADAHRAMADTLAVCDVLDVMAKEVSGV